MTEKHLDLSVYRHSDGSIRKYTDLGGYPIWYLTQDGGALCAECVQSERPKVPDTEQTPDWTVVAADVNWEDPEFYCEHCSERIESAYADDEKNGTPEKTS